MSNDTEVKKYIKVLDYWCEKKIGDDTKEIRIRTKLENVQSLHVLIGVAYYHVKESVLAPLLRKKDKGELENGELENAIVDAVKARWMDHSKKQYQRAMREFEFPPVPSGMKDKLNF